MYRHPFALDEPLVEHARVQRLVPLPYRRGQGGVILHCEVQIERVLLLRLLYPFGVEPVSRELGVAVEPEPRALDRAPRQSLLNERARHKRHLVEQHSREGYALNKRRGRLVLAAEKVKAQGRARIRELNVVFAELLLTPEAAGAEHSGQRRHDIAPERSDGLAAEGEVAAAPKRDRPEHERKRHTQRFSAAHRAVADQRVARMIGRALVPPAQHPELLGRKRLNHCPHPKPFR